MFAWSCLFECFNIISKREIWNGRSNSISYRTSLNTQTSIEKARNDGIFVKRVIFVTLKMTIHPDQRIFHNKTNLCRDFNNEIQNGSSRITNEDRYQAKRLIYKRGHFSTNF